MPADEKSALLDTTARAEPAAVDHRSIIEIPTSELPLTGRVVISDAEDGRPDPVRDGLERRIAELSREITELHEAVRSRELIGWVSGLLANRFQLDQAQAWQLLVLMSQNTNVKLREVARVISAAHAGTLAPDDQSLAVRLNGQLDASLGTLRHPRGIDDAR